ncbi:RNA polymerase sigma factor [Gimesia alba]|nr:sigma-70 family RNA polymerase sigma factor [Gimesia alba]
MSVPLDNSMTHVSLLARLREDDRDASAWRTFVDRYGRRIYEWCLARGLQPADSEDVTQEVLLKLARHLGTFEYNPQLTFRGWLRRVAENSILDFLRQKKVTRNLNSEGSHFGPLNAVAARVDLASRLEEAFDLELFDLAKERVRTRVERQRWQAWELSAVQQLSGEEVSQQLGMKVPTVYSSRYQIQKLIMEEVQQLEAEVDTHLSLTLSGTNEAS